MQLDPDICYRALAARDARFDGQFFVGVRSTGIYCRPICQARLPKAGKLPVFSRAPAAAEAAGLRPCLLCRPELAPGLAAVSTPASAWPWPWPPGSARADLDAGGIEALGRSLGITARHGPPGLSRPVRRLARRLCPDPAPASGQAAADRHRPVRDRGGPGQRFRQPAPPPGRVPGALPSGPDRPAPARNRRTGRRRQIWNWVTGRPTTGTACWPFSRSPVRGRGGGGGGRGLPPHGAPGRPGPRS